MVTQIRQIEQPIRRHPVTWFPAPGAGITARSARETRPPLITRSTALMPVRVDPAEIRPGDRFGWWAVRSIETQQTRIHGLPCHCVWEQHTFRGCPGFESPGCPCGQTGVSYSFICECMHGPELPPVVRKVSVSSLITGDTMSCGKCWAHLPKPVRVAINV